MSEVHSAMEKGEEKLNPLFDKWVLWAHLPHDTDWSIKSYKPIMEIITETVGVFPLKYQIKLYLKRGVI